MAGLDSARRAAEIVRDAGGQIVGRTRLQKIAFFLEAAGLGADFPFRYKHYGPYSDLLAYAAQHASALHMINEMENVTGWGGTYSTFTSRLNEEPNPARANLAQLMVKADAVELELAATAAYLALEGHRDPWGETKRRKPEKSASGRLDNARRLYESLRRIPTPRPLPPI